MAASGRSISGMLVAAIAFLGGAGTAQAACNTTTNPLVVTQMNPLALGAFIRPHTGDGTVRVDANGAATLPSNLNPVSSNPMSPNKAKLTAANQLPQAASVLITGGGGCAFKIEVESVSSSDLFNVSFLPAAGLTLSTTGSGAQGTIPPGGSFTLTLGISQRVTSSPGQIIGGTVRLLVTYI